MNKSVSWGPFFHVERTKHSVQNGNDRTRGVQRKNGRRLSTNHQHMDKTLSVKTPHEHVQNGDSCIRTSYPNGHNHQTPPEHGIGLSNVCDSKTLDWPVDDSMTINDNEVDWNGGVDNSTNGLSYEEMWELQQILDKRVKCKLSDGMSPEARKAMELARMEEDVSGKRDRKVKHTKKHTQLDKLPELELPTNKKKLKKRISFFDAYESSSASRLSGDMTDENSCDGNGISRRWALGGGNINVAMETVEIVSYGETLSDSEADDLAIEETAKLNSVEKCLVWMGVHSEEDFQEER